MSTIENLSILGIRSFGTNNSDEQKISFSAPLTLILGENGCGKTTIIECLKYALTGDLPPSSNKGQSFVHDPIIFNTSECLGKVMLEIRDKNGDKYCANRAVKCTVPKKKGATNLKFETIDGTLSHYDKKIKKWISISSRCTDLNIEIPKLMGVSKAIINNVLFCHQEDSNWPLDDGQKLKDRFDLIFGLSEFNTSIEKMMKLRKTYDEKAKRMDGDIKLALHMKNDAETKNLDLQRNNEGLLKLENTLAECAVEKKPIEDRLAKIRSIELDVSKLYTEKTEVSTKLNKSKEQETNLRKKIKQIFDGSLLQLDNEMRTFKDQQFDKKTNLKECENELSRIKLMESRLQTQLSDIDRKSTTLIIQRQQEQEFTAERAKIIKDLCELVKVPINIDLENENEQLNELLSAILTAISNEEIELSNMSHEHDKCDHEFQTIIDKLREKRTKIESDLNSLRKQNDERKQEYAKNQQEIDQAERSVNLLQKLTSEIEKLTKCYDNCSREFNVDESKQVIAQKRGIIKDLQSQLDKLDEELVFLNSISKILAEITIKEKQLEQRQTDGRKIRNKHADNLKRLLNNDQQTAGLSSLPSSLAIASNQMNYERRIRNVYQQMQQEISDINKTVTLNQRSITELQMSRKSRKDELDRLERELKTSEERIYEHCMSTPFIEVLERVKETIAKHQLDIGALKASDVLYKKYLTKIDDTPCCPLCHKDMSTADVGELTNELQDELRRLPENIQRTERILVQEQRKYDSLLMLQPVTDRVNQLKIEIPNIQQKLKEIEEKLSTSLSESETLEISLAEPDSNMKLANSMISDMSLLDRAHKEIQQFELELTELKTKMPIEQQTSGITLEAAQQKRTDLNVKLRAERINTETLETKLTEQIDKMNELREKRNKMKDALIQLQESVQALGPLKQRQIELSGQMETFTIDIREMQTQLNPLNADVQEVVNKKQKKKNDNRELLQKATKTVQNMKRLDSEIKRCSDEIDKLLALNLDTEIERLKTSMTSILEQKKDTNKRQEENNIKIEQIRKEISGQELKERDLNDNRELKMLESEISELKLQLDRLTTDMSDYDFQSVTREKGTLIKELDEIMGRRSECVGRIAELKSQITALKNELEQNKYKNSVRNYRETLHASITLKKMVSDLSIYRSSMENALMLFHTEKMNQINCLLKRLWHTIYRGNDIDYIQIKTDELGIKGSEKKRSYNYHVVQIKNNSELDMKGRCSAGQRVLACLIIRIALAETFSSHCGVLALDEPTTNLDRSNIQSLCLALNQLVEDRRSQYNFMLLIITHDEEFMMSLGQVENYWKLSRGDTGKSIITNVMVK